MNHDFFQYDPESKRQSMHWKNPSSPRQKKARQSKSKFKAMMFIFFDIWGMFTWIGCLKVRPLTRSTKRRFWQTFVNGWGGGGEGGEEGEEKEEEEEEEEDDDDDDDDKGDEEEEDDEDEEDEEEDEENEKDEEEEEDLKCGRMTHGFFTKMMHQHTSVV